MIDCENSIYDYCMCIAVIHHLATYENRKQSIKELIRVTKPNGKIFMEIGYTQKRIIEELFIKYGYKNINFFNDLSGKARVVCVKKDAI